MRWDGCGGTDAEGLMRRDGCGEFDALGRMWRNRCGGTDYGNVIQCGHHAS